MTRIEKLKKLLELRKQGVPRKERIQVVKLQADEDLDQIDDDEMDSIPPPPRGIDEASIFSAVEGRLEMEHT